MYALHYVFLPRINNQLTQFANAWNRHPLRTEGGLTPLQLWTRGLLSASPYWQEEISSGLMMHNYGVETNSVDFSSDYEDLRVTIPALEVSMDDQELEYLRVILNLFGEVILMVSIFMKK